MWMEPEGAKACDTQYYELLEELQALDFVLVELNLYLDTHPGDYQSIEQYNKFTQNVCGWRRSFNNCMDH